MGRKEVEETEKTSMNGREKPAGAGHQKRSWVFVPRVITLFTKRLLHGERERLRWGERTISQIYCCSRQRSTSAQMGTFVRVLLWHTVVLQVICGVAPVFTHVRSRSPSVKK